MKLPNRNQILLAIGFLATQGPNLSAVAAWLASSGIPHMTGVVTLLGWMVTALGSLAIAWPRIRSALAAGGLATPPGAVAPWNPTRDAGPVPPVALVPNRETISGPDTLPPAGTRSGAGYPGKGGALLIFLVASLLSTTALAQALGHCLLTNADGTCKLVVQPDVIKPVLDLNLKTGKVSGGIDVAALGACWGATYQPAAWYASGFDLCFNLVGSQTSPTVLYPSGAVHFLNYGMIGAGPYCAADGVNGAFECQWHLLLGGNLALDFGPNASAAAAKKARAEAAR